MKLSHVKATLGAEVLTGETESVLDEIDIFTACGCDLMSDVLAFVKDQTLLLTGLINPQVIRTAEMMDIVAICFVRGKVPPREVIDLAVDRGITLITTNYPLYMACGMLYEKGLGGRGCAETL
ncbi:MAG: hypothetical protein Q8873_01130 [Bacillota bacterium]|nr:hypothetical protein [Bacillota bacterium]